MDEVEKRLKETGEACVKCYEAWRTNQKDRVAREALQEAVHEMRKVASRVEIELAVSERDEMAQKPIPIPPHRDSRRKSQGEMDDNAGNILDDHNMANQRPPQQSFQQQQQPRRRPHGGGSGGGGGRNREG